MNDFYTQYQNLSEYELIQIVLQAKDYQPEAVEAAKQIITEKNWTKDLEEKIALEKRVAEAKEAEEEQDILDKAEYYKTAVEFKQENNSIQIRIGDIPKFEAALHNNNIRFFKEDKNVDAFMGGYPTQSYYFKNEDVDAVYKLAKDLEIVSNPYMDAKPFWGFEMKALLIALVVITSIFVLGYLFHF